MDGFRYFDLIFSSSLYRHNLLLNMLLGITICLLAMMLYMVSKLCTMRTFPRTNPREKAMIKEKFLIDYVYYSSFVLLKPKVGNAKTLRCMWKNSISGLILMITLSWGGFLMTEYYLCKFLSSLTLPYYEKPIEDISGKGNVATC